MKVSQDFSTDSTIKSKKDVIINKMNSIKNKNDIDEKLNSRMDH